MAKIGVIRGVNQECADYYCQRIDELADEMITDDLRHFVYSDVDLDSFTPKGLDKYWNSIAGWFMAAATELTNGETRCDYIAITTNFLHKFNLYGEMMLQKELTKPKRLPAFIDMNDCIAEKLESIFAKRVLMLGPSYVMNDPDLERVFKENYDVELMDLTDYREEVEEIDRIIREELVDYQMTTESKEFLVNFVNQFPADSDERPDAIVLGCYELSLILEEDDIADEIPLIDGAEVHIRKIVDLAQS